MAERLNNKDLPKLPEIKGEWLADKFAPYRTPIPEIERVHHTESRELEEVVHQMIVFSYDNDNNILPANIRHDFIAVIGDCFFDMKSLFKSLRRRGYKCGEVLEHKISKEIIRLYQGAMQSCIRDGDEETASKFMQDKSVNQKYLEIYNEFFDRNVRLSKKPYIVDQWFLTSVLDRPDTSSYWDEGHGNPGLYIALYNSNTGEVMQEQFEIFKREYEAIDKNKKLSDDEKKKERMYLARGQMFERQIKESNLIYKTVAKTMPTCKGIDVAGLTPSQVAFRVNKFIKNHLKKEVENGKKGKRKGKA